MKKLAASAKWTAEPPSIRSRSPNGVLTLSKAIDPTTVRDTARDPARLPRLCEAFRSNEFGGPEVMELVELPDPEPAEGEVVVDVARAGINFADTHATRNDYLAEQTLPMIPGGEIAGRLADGGRVAALLAGGGYAEKVAVPAQLAGPASPTRSPTTRPPRCCSRG